MRPEPKASGDLKKATLAEARKHLGKLVEQVKQGETILILDGGRPVARLVPVPKEECPEDRLARLERQGLLRRGSVPLPCGILMQRPPKPS